MSFENRSNSALFKRAEQIKRWEESETNRESTTPKRDRRKVKFSAGCVFLAACAAGDRDEVIRLLQNGADIDTANVDGLTALHQACIDDNLEMVDLLVSRGADVNRGDNEGWTPLHATASCGFLSIARLLIESGADVAAINNDGLLPLDIAESDDMEFLLFSHITAMGIDCDKARNKEERMMLADAKEWLNSGQVCDKPHPKTGATALHVAAAKGYIKVIDILLQAGADVNTQDLDGWTALHAASHWAQREACELLIEGLADLDIKNYVGQTPEEVADVEILPYLEDMRKKQASVLRGRANAAILPSKRSSQQQQSGAAAPPGNKRRSLDADISSSQPVTAPPTSPSAPTSHQATTGTLTNNNNTNNNNNQQILAPSSVTRMSAGDKQGLVNKDVSAERSTLLSHDDTPTESEETTTTTTTSEESEIEKRNRANRGDTKGTTPPAPSSPPRAPIDSDEPGMPSWRRPGSLRGRTNGSRDQPPEPSKPPSNRPAVERNSVESNPEVVLRRTHSFEADDNEKTANSAPVSPTKTPGSLNLSGPGQIRSPAPLAVQIGVSATAPATPSTPTTPTTPGGSKLSPGNIFKNFFKSFVPPVRDEESETQRKAHAKRVRETRRSTQGVTLEEIKSAEQLVKQKKQQTEPSATPAKDEPSVTAVVPPPRVPPAETTPAPTVVIPNNEPTTTAAATTEEGSRAERRPSWRLKFLLEDARGSSTTATANDTQTSYTRRGSASTRPSVLENNVDSSVTVALRRPAAKIIPPAPVEDKDQDKENDSRSAQATQAVIQRRRRPKRRSTGVVHVDMDEIDPERQDGAVAENDESSSKHIEESDRSGRSSRLSSVSSSGGAEADGEAVVDETPAATENGELDYKKLYEESRVENERLRMRLRRVEDELRENKAERQTGAKSSMSEAEKRERRAMERKLSEMEEELKQFQKLKAENEKLRAENRALTRVVSKLSQTAATHNSNLAK